MSSITPLRTLDALNFDNSFYNSLPADPVEKNYRRQVENACYSKVQPVPQPNSQLIAYSRDMAMTLGLNPMECTTQRFTDVFSGTKLLPGMQPYAACYGGHQFGNWAGQLGDGRAINLGEAINPAGERWALQLKGSGPTPYSRGGDGYAVLRSSIREFLCSEAMHYLRVPTTRALSLIGTGQEIDRDMFYNGNIQKEPGAIVCRAAPSFIRFGNFEIFSARDQFDVLKQLINYTLKYYFPHLFPRKGEPTKDTYLLWFNEVALLTAKLITEWMRVGFVHGVMNTDNMSIHGLTIDYGPYGWLEDYDPYWTPNTTDAATRRYTFGNQPDIGHWNLWKFANALFPVVDDAEALEYGLKVYKKTYDTAWRDMMTSKLGLRAFDPESDEILLQALVRNMKNCKADMTIFFRSLAHVDIEGEVDAAAMMDTVRDCFYKDLDDEEESTFRDWMLHYRERLLRDGRPVEVRRRQMDAVNPVYVLRNYLALEAIEATEAGDNSKLFELMEVLKTPYREEKGKEHLARKRPDWAKNKAGASMLSCSS